VAVKIKLKRMGKIHAPFYRIIVADARTKRDGRAIEEIGKYHPKNEPSFIEVDSERAQHWLSVGAQPTDPVRKILEITGDWQKFKGLPGAEGTLRTAEPKANKKDAYSAAVAEAVGVGDATKSRGRRPGAKADGDQADADTGATKAGSGRATGRTGGRQGGQAAPAKAGKPESKPDAAKVDAKADTAKADAKTDTAKADVKADTAKADAKTDTAEAGTAKADTAKADAKADSAKADSAKADAKADTAKAGTAKADTKADEAKASTAKTEAAESAGAAEPAAQAAEGDGA
jgi:small subunit ribosomal protein S16